MNPPRRQGESSRPASALADLLPHDAVERAVAAAGGNDPDSIRHPAELGYSIERLPEVPAVLRFIQQHAGQDDNEAYSTFNMGAGFALFVAADDAQRTVEVALQCGVPAWVAGAVEAGDKKLVIEPLGVEFSGQDLQLR